MAKSLFPVGEIEKPIVRAIGDLGLITAEKKTLQEFVYWRNVNGDFPQDFYPLNRAKFTWLMAVIKSATLNVLHTRST